MQFFRTLDIELSGFGQKNQARANRLLRGGRERWPEPTTALVRNYLHFAKRYRELLGGDYGDSSESSWWLHHEYVPDLLSNIEVWASLLPEESLAARVAAARTAYASFETR